MEEVYSPAIVLWCHLFHAFNLQELPILDDVLSIVACDFVFEDAFPNIAIFLVPICPFGIFFQSFLLASCLVGF